MAFTKTGTSKLPIGNNQWYFTQSNCSDEGKEYRTLNLLQDAEQPGNFCCYDGTCFSSEFVCDGTLHCESGEDEDFCEMIKVPKYYNKYDPPKQVYVNISIVDILTINEDDSSFDLHFHMKMKWFDEQLKFEFLKVDDYANIVSKEQKSQIWIPNIDFAFLEKQKSCADCDSKIYVQKNQPTMTTKKDDKFFYIETYDGGSTPLIHVSDHNMQFFCGFDGISLYPMEIETCSFYFYLIGPANFLTKINITKLEAPIGKVIGRYVITEWNIITDYKYSRSEKKMVKVSVTLTMNSLSILLVTYLPTLLMNIINQATNYITGDSKYDLIITVNITSMVVLATIYLSVFTSLPSTADIKPVEYWLLVSLAYPFLVIITNVVLQVGHSYSHSQLTNKQCIAGIRF